MYYNLTNHYSNQSKKQIEIWKTAQTRWNLKENAAMANQSKKQFEIWKTARL